MIFKLGKETDTRILAQRHMLHMLRILLIIADAAIVAGSLMLAYWVRIRSGLMAVNEDFDLGVDHLWTIVCITGIALYTFNASGFYRYMISVNVWKRAWIVVKNVTVVMLVLVAFSYMTKSGQRGAFQERRLIIIFAWTSAVSLMLALRCVLLPRLMSHEVWRKNVLILGAGQSGRLLAKDLDRFKRRGFDAVGFLDDSDELQSETFHGVPVLGTIDDLERVAAERSVNEVFISISTLSHERMLSIIALCKAHKLKTRILSDMFEMLTGKVNVETLSGLPLITMKETPLVGLNLFLKRATDMVLSGLGLVVLSPLFLFLTVYIKRRSKGPVFFRQTRVGKDGTEFTCLKFRTMEADASDDIHKDYMKKLIKGEDVGQQAESGKVVHKMQNDPRIIPGGAFLRRYSIDELPQLINVFKGEMSLVGPRPPIPYEVDVYDEWHKKRFEVLPGITGFWQVSGRTEIKFQDMVLLDIYYIENWSFMMDVRILLKTIPVILFRKGGY